MFFPVMDLRGNIRSVNPEHVVQIYKGKSDEDFDTPCTIIQLSSRTTVETLSNVAFIEELCNKYRRK